MMKMAISSMKAKKLFLIKGKTLLQQYLRNRNNNELNTLLNNGHAPIL